MPDGSDKSESRRPWSRDELIVAFNLYCKTPFGKLHKSNPEIVRISSALGRTPSALAMKLVNFASLDPIHKARNVKGLSHASKSDLSIWHEFHNDWYGLALESEQVVSRIVEMEPHGPRLDHYRRMSEGATEAVRQTKARLVQGFFRSTILAGYSSTCAVCQLAIPELLIASHIIPWHVDPKRRADPTNGIALCALHDRAFDAGLIAIDDSYRMLLSTQLKDACGPRLGEVAFLEFEKNVIQLPKRFLPDLDALRYHRQNIYVL